MMPLETCFAFSLFALSIFLHHCFGLFFAQRRTDVLYRQVHTHNSGTAHQPAWSWVPFFLFLLSVCLFTPPPAWKRSRTGAGHDLHALGRTGMAGHGGEWVGTHYCLLLISVGIYPSCCSCWPLVAGRGVLSGPSAALESKTDGPNWLTNRLLCFALCSGLAHSRRRGGEMSRSLFFVCFVRARRRERRSLHKSANGTL
jgi:hypothetical protein